MPTKHVQFDSFDVIFYPGMWNFSVATFEIWFFYCFIRVVYLQTYERRNLFSLQFKNNLVIDIGNFTVICLKYYSKKIFFEVLQNFGGI